MLKRRRTQAASMVHVAPAPAFQVSLPAAFQVPPPAKIRSRPLHWLLSRSPSSQGLSSGCCAGPNTRQGPSIRLNPGSSFHCGSGTSNS
ncbi:hypothetical protein DPMN_017176 [Dreissena polymorpha]|uniref:Uncharacterized protein n=1 Tax=Dreissena polymorpha TaxID=45954 RepID=A0A9D4NH02_DREPO|nr:hypothetical protein DPMN_017174 [Dreissena polymorpha]KAH3893037.1 hypothetical protein DPMN_017176 [Dreissena polymorpha]